MCCRREEEAPTGGRGIGRQLRPSAAAASTGGRGIGGQPRPSAAAAAVSTSALFDSYHRQQTDVRAASQFRCLW